MTEFKKNDKLVVIMATMSKDLPLGRVVYALEDGQFDEIRVAATKGGAQIGSVAWMSKRFKLATKLDFSKPLETLGGRSFTLLTAAGRSSYPVVGYLDDANGRLSEYTAEGECASGHPAMNLRNVAVKPMTTELVIYKNLYIEDGKLVAYGYHKTREQANNNAGSGRVGVNKVVTTLTEGQFDA